MDIDVGQPDGFQLAFIQLGFQAFTILLNVGLLVTQQVMTGILSFTFELLTGAFGQLVGAP